MRVQYCHDITWKGLQLDALLDPVHYEILRKYCNTWKVLQYLESIAILCNIVSVAKLYHSNGE